MSVRRLELGSGYQPWQPDDPEWEHADLNPNAPHVEHVCDLSKSLPFEDETFTELRATDILEHIGYRATNSALKEWARILTPGGKFYIQVPDAALIMRWFAQGDTRLCVKEGRPCSLREGAEWRLLGGQADGTYVEEDGNPYLNLHMALFDKEHLVGSLEAVGFAVDDVRTNSHPNLLAWATKK